MLAARTYSFVLLLFLALLLANLVPDVSRASFSPTQFAGTLAIAAPFVIAAIASTPAILSGGGGIDLSIGPLLGFVNVIFVVRLIPELDGPATAIPILVGIGLLVGLLNGLLVAIVRLQPIVATLGTYLIIIGWSLKEAPQPIGQAPEWIVDFRGSFGPVPGAIVLVAIPVIVWLALMRTPFHKALLAVGGDERAAFSAGINVAFVRVGAYMLGGFFAVWAGLALTALIQSADPLIGPQYTLVAIAAVAIGGTSLAGGRGGITGSILGAAAIFLIQNLLSGLRVSSLWLQVVYGGILIAALVANAVGRELAAKRRGETVVT